MQSVAIYSPQSDVMRILLEYLETRKYKSVSVNYTNNEVTAERKRSLFNLNKFYFKIVNVNPHVTNIEIKVNPQNDKPTSYDMKKEVTVAERIYSYF